MIRLYFDSDVINNIHAGRMPELAKFIEIYRHRFLIIFSQAHINDKLPSKKVAEKKFWKDIDFISEFSESKLVNFDDKKGYTRPYNVDVRQLVEEVENNIELLEEFSSIDNIIKFMKETCEDLGIPSMGDIFESMFDVPTFNIVSPESYYPETFKEQLQDVADKMSELRNNPDVYKESQNLIQNQFAIPTHAGQWTESVIDKIDHHLKSQEESHQDFFSLVDGVFPDMGKVTIFSYYITAYQILNMIGYKSDEISSKKGKGMLNHLQDAMHSFYGAHCDYFVVMDKKLSAKSKALYEKFGITTKLIHPNDLVAELSQTKSQESITEIIRRVLSENPIEELEEEGVYKYLYRINSHWLDYFTHVQCEFDIKNSLSTCLFTKMGATYSNFMFYEECDKVIELVMSIFGFGVQREEVIAKFRSNDPNDRFVDYFMEDIYIRFLMNDSKLYLSVNILNSNKQDLK